MERKIQLMELGYKFGMMVENMRVNSIIIRCTHRFILLCRRQNDTRGNIENDKKSGWGIYKWTDGREYAAGG